jgi:hypothetical protein
VTCFKNMFEFLHINYCSDDWHSSNLSVTGHPRTGLPSFPLFNQILRRFPSFKLLRYVSHDFTQFKFIKINPLTLNIAILFSNYKLHISPQIWSPRTSYQITRPTCHCSNTFMLMLHISEGRAEKTGYITKWFSFSPPSLRNKGLSFMSLLPTY